MERLRTKLWRIVFFRKLVTTSKISSNLFQITSNEELKTARFYGLSVGKMYITISAILLNKAIYIFNCNFYSMCPLKKWGKGLGEGNDCSLLSYMSPKF